jgi:type I restriction enzyme S subunit
MSWPLVKFSEVATVVTGSTPKKEVGNYDGDVPFVTPGDLGIEAVIVNSKTTVTEKGANSGRILPEGAVLVCCIGATIGKVGIAGRGLITNQQINSLIFDENKVFPKFGYYFCIKLKPELVARSSSTTMPIVNKSNFSKLEIPLPPLDEQKRIAAILDKADAIRRKRKQAIQLADDFLRSVFLDMFGDPVSNSKGWELKALKYGIEKIESGWSAKGESYPCGESEKGVLKISSVTSGIFKPTENKFIDSKDIPENRSLVFPAKGDLLFSRANTRELVAATCIVTETRNDVFLPDKLWKVKTLSSQLLPEFLHFMVQHPKFKNILTSQATGTSGSMLNISKSKFEESVGIFPPIELQATFQKIFWKVSKISTSYVNSAANIDQSFLSLSQKAFAGEL